MRRHSVAQAATAMAGFLEALGIPAQVLSAADVVGTPERVAEAWRDDLVDGYRRDPVEILAETMRSSGDDMVAVTGIDFHAICPHHLLPYHGVAHVAYVPDGKVVGFGQLARLVDCFAHRLVIEEELARQIAGALMKYLGARGAACVLDAQQLCLTVRGERRRAARAHAQCLLGVLQSDRRLSLRFLQLAGRAGMAGAEEAARSSGGGGRARSRGRKRG
jgi:GTP cyclohydrolase IA